MDTLDYSGPAINQGSKGIFIGVGPAKRDLPHHFNGDLPQGARSVAPYCAGCLTVAGPSYNQDPQYAQHLAQDPALADWPLVFLLDHTGVVERQVTFLWSSFTRFEPAADIYAAATRLVRHHPCYTPPIVFDCRMKPGYPDELVADANTVKKVSQRWQEYFPHKNVIGEEDPLGYAGFRLMD